VLLRHTLLYLAARGLPGAVNFLAIALYTRLLDPVIYGKYTLVLAGIGLADALLFQWLRLGLLRFLPGTGPGRSRFLHTVRVLFLRAAALGIPVAAAAWFLLRDRELALLSGLALGLLWLQAWFELNLELVRTQLSPVRYGLLAATRAVLSLGFAVLFITAGWGVAGILLALALGMTVPYLVFGVRREWSMRDSAGFSSELGRKLFRYGLPLTFTFALGFIVSTSDRFLLAWLAGTGSTGLYAASYDLSQFTIGMIMMVINLAAYPLIVRAMEEQGPAAARSQLRSSALLLIAVGLPAAAGLSALAPGVAAVIIGPGFRAAAVGIIPLISLAAFIAAFKSFHVDVGFQLGDRTGPQAWVMLVAALLNMALNLWWIPLAGITGAVWGTVVSYLAGLLLSWLLVRRIFPVPAPPAVAWKAVAATGVMVLVLMRLPVADSLLALVLQVAGGSFVYGAVLAALMPARIRFWLLNFNTRRSGNL
jgi:O-antigen/teichoic acid export membrane protein